MRDSPAPVKPLRRRAMTGVIMALAVLAPAGLPSCAAPYHEPCAVADDTFLVRETSLPLGISGRSLPRVRLARDGSMEATWISTTRVRTNGAIAETVVRGDVVFASADGSRVRRAATAAPRALEGRRGSTTSLGVLALPDGLLFAWIEDDIRTLANGARRTSSRVMSQLVRWDGTEGTLIDSPTARCDDCALLASFSHGSRSAAIVVTLTYPDASRRALYMNYAPDGSLVRADDLSWAGRPAGDVPEEEETVSGLGSSVSGITVEFLGDSYAVVAEGQSHFYDEDFRPQNGGAPIALPNDASYALADGRLTLAWTDPVDGAHALRDDSSLGRGEGRGIYLARRNAVTGALLSPERRVSVGAVVLGVTARGLSFRAADARDYFARVSEAGEKVGGDVALPAVPGTTLSALWGAEPAATDTVVSFSDVRVGPGVIYRRRIVCER